MSSVFTVPVPPLGPHPGGSIICTQPTPGIYLLTISSPPDNRLTTATCTAWLSALDTLEFRHVDLSKGGVLVTTSAIPKFYSNGLDLEHAMGTEGFMPNQLYRLFLRFLTFPLPTIALMNGHAFAAGLMLATAHDYRLMSPSRGFACVNELDFGVPLKPAMSALFRCKLSAPSYRSLVLEARRFGGQEALASGLVDGLAAEWEHVVGFVDARRLGEKARTGIYGAMKREMFRDVIGFLTVKGHEREEKRLVRLAEEEQERRRVGWESGRAKL